MASQNSSQVLLVVFKFIFRNERTVFTVYGWEWGIVEVK